MSRVTLKFAKKHILLYGIKLARFLPQKKFLGGGLKVGATFV